MSDALSLTKDVKKAHRVRKSGAKANKKANKDGKVCEQLLKVHIFDSNILKAIGQRLNKPCTQQLILEVTIWLLLRAIHRWRGTTLRPSACQTLAGPSAISSATLTWLSGER
jgi:hypothetical protein